MRTNYRSFARNLETYKMLTRLRPPQPAISPDGKVVSFFSESMYYLSATQLNLQSKTN